MMVWSVLFVAMPLTEQERKLSQYLREHPDLRAVLQGQNQRIVDYIDAGSYKVVQEDELIRRRANAYAREAIRRAARRKRIGITGISIAAALVILFAFIPRGQTGAKVAYQNSTNQVGSILYIRGKDNEGPTQDFPFKKVDPASFHTIADATKYLSMNLIAVKSKDISPTTIQIDSSDAQTFVTTTYEVSPGKGFFIDQTVFPPGTGWGGTVDLAGGDPFTVQLYNGETLYCGVSRDGFALSMAHWKNVELSIASTTMKWDELLKYVQLLGEVNQ